MRYLLDTHVLIWAVSRSEKLSADARRVLARTDGVYFFSPVSVWEIAIKHGKHPDDMPMTGKEAARLFREAGFRELKPDAAQRAVVEDLPPIHAMVESAVSSNRIEGIEVDENTVMAGRRGSGLG